MYMHKYAHMYIDKCMHAYIHNYTVEPLLKQTLRIKDSKEKTSIIRTKILVPTGVTNTFLTSERAKPLYCCKK